MVVARVRGVVLVGAGRPGDGGAVSGQGVVEGMLLRVVIRRVQLSYQAHAAKVHVAALQTMPPRPAQWLLLAYVTLTTTQTEDRRLLHIRNTRVRSLRTAVNTTPS